jgi:hypothetical protein
MGPRPEHADWYPDPWGDGWRYWDGAAWTRRIADSAPAPPAAAVRTSEWELADPTDDEERPFRPGWASALVWVGAAIALIALLVTAVSIWPVVLRGSAPAPTPPATVDS